MKCKICNEEQTIRSMAMHLRWSHKMKTDEYVTQYGEFRSKNIVQTQIKQTSHLKCQICNEDMMHNRQLMYHITKKHKNITQEEYIIKYQFNGIRPTCKCGCGNNTEFLRYGEDEKGNQWFRAYIKGHWDWIKEGYFNHTDEAKEKIKQAGIKRKNEEIEKYGKRLMHSNDALIKRANNNWVKIADRIKIQYNVICTNINSDLGIKHHNVYNFKCLKCDNEWTQYSFYPNCQKCNPPTYIGSSNEEKDILKYIQFIYNGEIISNSRQIINPYEIDIYLPDLKIGIEYNGLYWHSEKSGKHKDYHMEKLKLAKEKGIRLIQIFSDEWLNKQDIVKSKLNNIINKSSTKIYARKCEIREIDTKIKNPFLNTNHIQGTCKSKVNLGIYYNNELYGVMTFNKPRLGIGKTKTQIPDSYELVRYATSYNIIGGASKLISYFIKTYKPKNIFSYSDNRWTDWDNNMYLKIGFKFSHITPPNYFYTLTFTERLHRFGFNKTILGKQGHDIINRTEAEIMNELGYTKIWDAGNCRYEMNIV